MKPHRTAHGYTLIEVLASAVIIGIAVSASLSMTSTMVTQEEMSWRTTVALNYQENSARLWQLGLTPFEVSSLMPGTAGNPLLQSILASTGTITELGTVDADGIGALEQATHQLQINNAASATVPGESPDVSVYRPSVRY